MNNFLYPLLLGFVPIILAIVWMLYKRKNKGVYVGVLSDIREVYSGNTWYYRFYYLLIALLFVVLVVIIAHPVKKTDEKVIKDKFLDISIVLDLSYSMLATDLEPSRFQASKNIIQEFLKNIEYARVGTYVFTALPFELTAPTFDYSKLRKDIKKLELDTINQKQHFMQGTASADALLFSSIKFNSEKGNVIILITDGEINKGHDISRVLQFLTEKNIRVYTIGVGKQEDTFIKLYDEVTNSFSILPVPGIDDETLQKISLHTFGKYYRAENNREFKEIFDEIYKIERKELEAYFFESLRVYYILLFLLLLIGTIAFRYKKFKN